MPVPRVPQQATVQTMFNQLRQLVSGAQAQPKAKAAARRRRRVTEAQINSLLRSIPTQLLDKQQRFSRGAPTSVSFAPRGQGLYDAFVRAPESMVLASQVGPVTVVEGYAHTVIRGPTPVDGTFEQRSKPIEVPGSPSDPYGSFPRASVKGNPVIIAFNPGSSTSHLANIYTLVVTPHKHGDVVTVACEEVHASALVGIGGGSTSYVNPYNGAGDGQPVYMEGQSLGTGTNLPYGTSGVTGAVESIPIRGSIKFRNITEHRNIGGDVRVMRYNGGLNLLGQIQAVWLEDHGAIEEYMSADGHFRTPTTVKVWDPAANDYVGTTNTDASRSITTETFLEIVDMMRDSARSLPLSGHDLVMTHQSNTYPADFVRAHTFKWDDTLHEAILTPKYNTTLILIDDFSPSTGEGSGLSPNNTYSITCKVQRACRFKPGTQMHNKAITLPADAQRHSKATAWESFTAFAKPIWDKARTEYEKVGIAGAAQAFAESSAGQQAMNFGSKALPLMFA